LDGVFHFVEKFCEFLQSDLACPHDKNSASKYWFGKHFGGSSSGGI
jgi:hypothetical protein